MKIQSTMLSAVSTILIFLILQSIAEANNQLPKIKKQQQELVCDRACTQYIDESVDYITNNLYQPQFDRHEELVKRVTELENEFYASIGRINTLSQQIMNLDIFIARNTSNLEKRVDDEARAVLEIATLEVTTVNSALSTRINDLTAVVNSIKNSNNNNNNGNTGGDSTAAMQVYYNVTRRIDNLEYDKISNLTADNNIWRRNFRVVNATFEKIKTNNNCLCK